jgi:hypothetical protein
MGECKNKQSKSIVNTFKEIEKARNTIIIKSIIRYGTVIEQE